MRSKSARKEQKAEWSCADEDSPDMSGPGLGSELEPFNGGEKKTKTRQRSQPEAEGQYQSGGKRSGVM